MIHRSIPNADVDMDAALTLHTQCTLRAGPALGGLGNLYSFARLLVAHLDAAICLIHVVGMCAVTAPAAAVCMYTAGTSVVDCATLLGYEGIHAFEILLRAALSGATVRPFDQASPTPSSVLISTTRPIQPISLAQHAFWSCSTKNAE
ncbi:hypothetical protein A0H81_08408 [Grifola frondosa]|uniref:Uncharacterized protein n=1 Tax=Grifola frondosa TaxID=5627 RepID=A0A1C7M453_GRIFR|nr:hypothetical protein A0H81_08408 [Grifola frondosa]